MEPCNHVVLMCPQAEEPYWLVKNQWGTQWGEEGRWQSVGYGMRRWASERMAGAIIREWGVDCSEDGDV